MKTCSRCHQEKPLSEFHVEKRRQRPMSVCKPCGVAKAREWRQRNPEFERRRYQRERLATRERHLVRKYGVTLAEYDRLLAQQGGKCAICEADVSEQFKAVFHVDHCHKTGAVRGLLCRGCNHMLGVVEDRPEVLERAIRYLESAPIVPQVAAAFVRAAA